MKKFFAVFLAAAMMLAMAACSSSEDKKDNDTTAAAEQMAESEPVEEEVIPDEDSSEQEQSSEQKTVSGTITDATMNTVTIETEDGVTLSFSIPEEANQTQTDGMTLGDTLEITYTGTIDGEDTSNAVVLKLVQTAADPQ